MRHFSCGFQVVFKLGYPNHFTYERLPKPIISYVQLRKLRIPEVFGVCLLWRHLMLAKFARWPCCELLQFLAHCSAEIQAANFGDSCGIRPFFFAKKHHGIFLNWSTGVFPQTGGNPLLRIKEFFRAGGIFLIP